MARHAWAQVFRDCAPSPPLGAPCLRPVTPDVTSAGQPSHHRSDTPHALARCFPLFFFTLLSCTALSCTASTPPLIVVVWFSDKDDSQGRRQNADVDEGRRFSTTTRPCENCVQVQRKCGKCQRKARGRASQQWRRRSHQATRTRSHSALRSAASPQSRSSGWYPPTVMEW